MEQSTQALLPLPSLYPEPLNEKYKRNWIFKTRIISLIIALFFCVYELTTSGFGYFRYFTQWGLMITNLYFGTALFAPNWKHLHQFFQIAWTNEALITIIFWLILLPVYLWHPDVAANYKSDLFSTIDRIAAHFVPIAALSFDFSLGNWTISRWDFVYSYFLMFCYAMFDGFIVMSGKPEAYPLVMTWQNALSLLTLLVLNVIMVGIFTVSYVATRKKRETDVPLP